MRVGSASLLAALALIGCGSSPETDVPSRYEFESHFRPGKSSVLYAGQTFRHVLIEELAQYIEELTEKIDQGDFMPTAEGDVIAALDFWYRFDSDSNGGEALRMSADVPFAQGTYDEIATGKDLVGKMADADRFIGWSDEAITAHGGSIDSPLGLVEAFFETIEANALLHAAGDERLGPDREPLPVHVTTSGLNLYELVEKFLLGAIVYAQGTDHYLADEEALRANSVDADEDGAYTALEHAWDEAFGYFGAARDYGDYTDDEISSNRGRTEYAEGYHDFDVDGAIDLTAEFNFGNAVYAAKRDRTSVVATDFTGEVNDAFLAARDMAHRAAGRTLTDKEIADMGVLRDAVIDAWERVIAASVVHYLNDSVHAMALFGTEEYDFAEHAGAWSEMKGLALALQFNPATRLSAEQLADLYDQLGDAPVLADAEESTIEVYRTGLLDIRDMLGTVYEFDVTNLGDESGEGGW